MDQRRKQQRAKAIEFEGKNDYHIKFSIAASVTPHSLLCGLNPARKYVIPACFYPSIFLGTVRFSNRRESRRNPDGSTIRLLRVVVSIVEPRLRHSGVTALEKFSKCLLIPR